MNLGKYRKLIKVQVPDAPYLGLFYCWTSRPEGCWIYIGSSKMPPGPSHGIIRRRNCIWKSAVLKVWVWRRLLFNEIHYRWMISTWSSRSQTESLFHEGHPTSPPKNTRRRLCRALPLCGHKTFFLSKEKYLEVGHLNFILQPGKKGHISVPQQITYLEEPSPTTEQRWYFVLRPPAT
jgi:hypothetical protein